MNNTYLSVYHNHTFQNDNQCVKIHVKLHPSYDSFYSYADSLSPYKFTNYNYTFTAGSSNIITTTFDLLKFDKAFFDGRLLKPSTMEEAFSPVKLNNRMKSYKPMDTMLGEGKMGYGLGWDIFELPGFGKSVRKGGFMFGNATFYFHILQNRQTIIAFDNAAVSEFGRIITSAFYLLNGNEPMVIRNHHPLAFVYGSTLVKDGPDAA